jgi:MerR family copper efflux transcriptional regulator
MVKASQWRPLTGSAMLISEFARTTGLTPDTIRFYVRRGLLTPQVGKKGGSNPYQIFTAEHVEAVRMIRMAQSLGFSLREITLLSEEDRKTGISDKRAAEILRGQLVRLEEKTAHIKGMTSYIRAKLTWLESGSKGAEPSFAAYSAAKRQKRGAKANK